MQPRIESLCDDGGFTERLTFDPANCAVWVTVTVGFGEGGGDLFTVQVVTSDYVKSCDKPLWGNNLLIIDNFTWEDVETAIHDMLSGISAENWEHAANQLSRYMRWEYEGM